MNTLFDVCVVGGGSGGFGAALAAARRGQRVLLVESGDSLGGNAARGGVNAWEMGVTSTPFAKEIYERLRERSRQVGINKFGRHVCWPESNQPPFPGGEHVIDESLPYEASLQRHGVESLATDEAKVRRLWHAVVYEPEPYSQVLQSLLEEGGCEVRLHTRYQGIVGSEDKRLKRIRIAGRAGEEVVEARVFIDATADALVCRDLGCALLVGTESHDQFQEPSAPEEAEPGWVNSVTLMFRVMPTERPPALKPVEPCWFRERWGVGSFVGMPKGGWNINMLPTMEGEEFLKYFHQGAQGYQAAYRECLRRVDGFWNTIRNEYPEFQPYEISWTAPALGVRETRRVVGETILTQNEVLAGYSRQDSTDLITLADHAMDLHGNKRRFGCSELQEPYGVPFGCLIPRGWGNVLIACRAASFTQIAASSCRLSRTMMSLGHAAGVAASLLGAGERCQDLDVADLRNELRKDSMLVDWKPEMTRR